MARRQPSKEKQLAALIEDALTCAAFCKNNPGWVLEAQHVLGIVGESKSELSNTEINSQQNVLRDRMRFLEELKENFELELEYKGFKVELWKSYKKGFTYRRRKEGDSTWRSCVDYFPTDREAIQAFKSEIDFGEA